MKCLDCCWETAEGQGVIAMYYHYLQRHIDVCDGCPAVFDFEKYSAMARKELMTKEHHYRSKNGLSKRELNVIGDALFTHPDKGDVQISLFRENNTNNTKKRNNGVQMEEKHKHIWVIGWLWTSGGATWLCNCGAVKEQSYDVPNEGIE